MNCFMQVGCIGVELKSSSLDSFKTSIPDVLETYDCDAIALYWPGTSLSFFMLLEEEVKGVNSFFIKISSA